MFFTIPGEPQGKMRPRYSRKTGVMYTPTETVHYEKKVRDCFRMAGGKKLQAMKEIQYDDRTFKTPATLSMEVWAFLTPPEKPKWRKELMLSHMIAATKKPDVDNIGKIILDALNGEAYEDDKQVTELIVHKCYGEPARVCVEINEI